MRLDRHCSASGMFTEANLNNFYAIRGKCIFGFICRLRDSDNTVIQTLVNQQVYTPSRSAICGADHYT